MSDDYEDSYQEQERKEEEIKRDLQLHLAKMIEHMEFEATLPDAEKSRRRLSRMILKLPDAAKAAVAHGMPMVLLGQLERVFHHASVAFGPNWMETASKYRSAMFGGDIGDEFEVEADDVST